ncbi:MAG TPA: hypothetical protein VHB47_22230, partial [Thermoanaerobaculia bacterium]|nr:hypothetical protein [Thermoanaerobaculia bacterium]
MASPVSPAPGAPPAPPAAQAGSAGSAGPAGPAIAPGLAPSEALRKATHVGMGFIAFSLRFLGPLWSAVLAGAALLNNLFVLHRIGGKKLWRDAEHQAGGSVGIVVYPLP